MSFGDRLKEARVSKGYTQEQLASMVGVAKSTLTGYERGNREPDVMKIKALTVALGISPDFLLETDNKSQKSTIIDGTLSSSEQTHITKYRAIDNHGKETVDLVLDREYMRCVPSHLEPEGTVSVDVYDEPAAAGYGNYLSNSSFDTIDFPESVVPNGTDFGVRISGDSMEPKIEDGSVVFVESRPAIENGQIGIFALNGDSYCKKLKIDHVRRKVLLVSLNSRYPDIEIGENDDLRTIGRVLGSTI